VPRLTTRVSDEEDKPRPTAPTPKMVAYAHSLARAKKVTLPKGYESGILRRVAGSLTSTRGRTTLKIARLERHLTRQ
jgi:hypothetical protein